MILMLIVYILSQLKIYRFETWPIDYWTCHTSQSYILILIKTKHLENITHNHQVFIFIYIQYKGGDSLDLSVPNLTSFKISVLVF